MILAGDVSCILKLRVDDQGRLTVRVVRLDEFGDVGIVCSAATHEYLEVSLRSGLPENGSNYNSPHRCPGSGHNACSGRR